MSNIMSPLRVSFVFLLAALPAHAPDEPVFAPPPRLAITAAELAERKKAADFPKLRDEAVRGAEADLKNPTKIPEGWGNWVFYYACPDDGTSLTALSETEHQCPRCKK